MMDAIIGMVDDFILVINEKRLRSRLKALRNYYKEIQSANRSSIERGEILMHLEYFNRIISELSKRYGTEALTSEGVNHIKNYKNELGKVEPDPTIMHQSFLGLRNILFALMPHT